MENTSDPQPFEQLPLARAEMPVALSGQYRVYSDAKNFKLVEALSAVAALGASGLSQAFKIEREALHKNTLIKPSFGQPPVPPVAEAAAIPAN